MKKGWMKLIAVMLVAAFVATLLPSPGREALAVGAYGKATADGVKVRKQPSTSAAYWFKIDNGYVCELLGTEASGGITVQGERRAPGSEQLADVYWLYSRGFLHAADG